MYYHRVINNKIFNIKLGENDFKVWYTQYLYKLYVISFKLNMFNEIVNYSIC